MKKLLISLLFIILLTVPVFAQNSVDVYFFYKPGCQYCAAVDASLQTMLSQNPNLTVHSINAVTNPDAFKSMLQQYNVPVNEWTPVPRTFISDETFLGAGAAIDDIENKIEYCLENECEPTKQPAEPEKQDLHLTKLITLAAADAVSPCELAVLTLLLTAVMLRNPGKKMKVLLSGFAFTFAIFLSYFTFGTLITFGFKSLTSISVLGPYLHTLLAAIAIIIGLINIKDFLTPEKPIAEVPVGLRPKMRQIIGKTASVPGSFVAGLLVSFLLTPCTIGPYFVAGGLLSEMAWTTSLMLLFAYNIIFIAPMIALVLIISFGVSNLEKITKWRNQKWKYTHLIIALLMFGLGIAMLMGWL